MSRTSLLNLAYVERQTLGYVPDYTRYLLQRAGLTSVDLEAYIQVRGG